MKLTKKIAPGRIEAPLNDNTSRASTGVLSNEALKWIAMGTMLIDHIGSSLIEGGLLNLSNPDSIPLIAASELGRQLYLLDTVLRLIGRIAFPIFCFLLVEGFLHTKNLKRYLLRLGLFALISEIPFDLSLFGTLFEATYQNVFWTLLFGLLVLTCLRFVEERTGKGGFPFSWASNPYHNVSGSGANRPTQTNAIGSRQRSGASHTSLYEQFNAARAAQAANMTVAELEKQKAERQAAELAEKQTTALAKEQAAATVSTQEGFDGSKSAPEAKAEASPAKPAWPAWLLWPLRLLIIGAGCIAALLFHCDYTYFGVALISILYLLRRDRFTQSAAGAVCCIWEPSAMLAFVATYFYNGQLGKHARQLKYIFYWFYPLHLLALGLVRLFFLQPLF